MAQKTSSTRAFLLILVPAFVLAMPLAALAVNPIFGTVQVNGPVFLNNGAHGWDKVELTRPMVAGDHLKTGEEGYLLADLGKQGVVGMYGDTEIATGGSENGPLIDVRRGKLAFHMGTASAMTITAADAEILSTGTAGSKAKDAADGYVEINSNGDAVVAVEDGRLSVRVAGVDRTLKKGERLLLNQEALGGEFNEKDRLAALDPQPATQATAPAALTDAVDAPGTPASAATQEAPAGQQIASADQAAGMDAAGRSGDDDQGKKAAMWAAGGGGIINNPVVVGVIGVGAVVGGVIAATNSHGSSDRNGSQN